MHLYQNACYTKIANCQTQTGTTCATCNNNYRYNSTPKTCTAVVNNCSTYNANGTCTSCNNLFMINGQCNCTSNSCTFSNGSVGVKDMGSYYVIGTQTWRPDPGNSHYIIPATEVASYGEAYNYCTNNGLKLPTIAELTNLFNALDAQVAPEGKDYAWCYWAAEGYQVEMMRQGTYTRGTPFACSNYVTCIKYK